MYLTPEQEREFLTAITPAIDRLLPKGCELNLLVRHEGMISLMSMTPPEKLGRIYIATGNELVAGLHAHQTISTSTKQD
jgi:hypothetical protein